MVWLDLGLNSSLPDHWRKIHPLGQWAGTMDLALNKLQRLICHKTQPTNPVWKICLSLYSSSYQWVPFFIYTPVKHLLSIFSWIYPASQYSYRLITFFCTSFLNAQCIAAHESGWWSSLHHLDFARQVSSTINHTRFIFGFNCWSHRTDVFLFLYFLYLASMDPSYYFWLILLFFPRLHSTTWTSFFGFTRLPELLSSASLDHLSFFLQLHSTTWTSFFGLTRPPNLGPNWSPTSFSQLHWPVSSALLDCLTSVSLSLKITPSPDIASSAQLDFSLPLLLNIISIVLSLFLALLEQ